MKYPAIFEPYAHECDDHTAFFLNFNTIFSTIYPTAQQIADDDGDSDGELIGSCSPSSMPYNEETKPRIWYARILRTCSTCYPDEVPPNESYTPVHYEVDHSDFAFINPYDYDHDTLRGRREVEVQQIGYMQFRIQQDYICFTEGKYAD